MASRSALANANVARLFFDAAEREAERPALLSSRAAPLTFGALRARSLAVARILRARGFAPGDRAVFLLGMSPELYATVLGTLAAGGVAVFVDPWVPFREIAAMAAAARPKALIGSARTLSLCLFSRRLRSIPISVNAGVLRTVSGGRVEAGDVVEVAPDAPAVITFTTGSSGRPKGVTRSHDILAAQHAVIRDEFPVAAGDVDLTTFPVFALSNLASGVPTVIPRANLGRIADLDAARLYEDIARYGVTTAAASPPLFDRLASHVRATGSAPLLRRIVTGGAPVRDEQLRAWREALPRTEIVVAYGSSEAEPVASITAEERLALDPRGGYCVGTPVAAVRTRLIPIHYGPVASPQPPPAGGIGELLVSGPHVTRDYADDDGSAFASNKVRDGEGTIWHRLGDTGRFDKGGRFWLVGRVHSTIVRAGALVHPQLAELAARGDDGRIDAVAAVGVDDPELGRRVTLVVKSETDVRDDVQQRLAAAGIPADDVVLTSDPLPVDPRHNSKIDYERLRHMLATGRLRHAEFVTRADPFSRRLRAYLRQRFPVFGHVLLIISYYSSNQFLAKAVTHPGEPMRYTAGSLLGTVTLLCFFFHLRVFDEHKDFADDSRFHPNRVLQRGVITLAELRRLAYVAIALEWALAAVAGTGPLVALAAAFGFSLLMLKEFFAAGWLKRHFLVYATSHMLLMPLLSLMIYSFATGAMPYSAPPLFLLYAMVGFFVTFNVEVARKIRAPHDEIEGLDSYSKQFGTYGAAWVVMALRVIDTTLVMIVGHAIGVPRWFYAALVALFLVAIGTFVRFRFRTTTAAAKAMEINAGVYLIAFDLILAAALVQAYGFAAR